MSIGSSEARETSRTQANAALLVFSNIQPNDKLRYHKTTGTFEIDRGGKNFSRTFDNFFRKQGTENSVTNDEMFRSPVLNAFKLVRFSTELGKLNTALAGLKNLRPSYAGDRAKLAKLDEILKEVQQLIDVPVNMSSDSLIHVSDALSRPPMAVFNSFAEIVDGHLPNSVVQHLTQGDRASLQVIFAAVRNSGSRINNNLKDIELRLGFFSNQPAGLSTTKKHELDVHYISKLIYIVLQEVEKADIQVYALTYHERWVNKIKSAVKETEFSPMFQSARHIAFDSDPASHPASDFLWFHIHEFPRGNITRLYFCPNNMYNVDQFIRVAWRILNTRNYILKFKIDYSKHMEFVRRDAIVLYFHGDMEKGRTLAAEFKDNLGVGYFKPNFGPFGGISVTDQNDVFWQPEPDRFDTGLSYDENKSLEQRQGSARQHSATSIRAELITMALLSWKIGFDYKLAKYKDGGLDLPDLRNPATFEYEFEVFQSYVAKALEGHKRILNPRQ